MIHGTLFYSLSNAINIYGENDNLITINENIGTNTKLYCAYWSTTFHFIR